MMKSLDVKEKSQLVYQLFYPGVLGSMLFDILDPLREWSLPRLALIFIAAAFFFDYIHMEFHLKVQRSPTPRPAWDAIIATMFCVAYFGMSHAISNAQVHHSVNIPIGIGQGGLLLTFLLTAMYETTRPIRITRAVCFRLLPLGICFVGTGVACLVPCIRHSRLLGMSALVTAATSVSYIFYVATWREIREPAQQEVGGVS